jgi:hypothetical protein
MADYFMRMYVTGMLQASQATTIELKLGEAFIVESLVELSGQVSTSTQLIEFFDAERINGGVVNLMILLAEMRDGVTQMEHVGVVATVIRMEQELKEVYSKTSCLGNLFTEDVLLSLEMSRRSASAPLLPMQLTSPDQSPSHDFVSPSMDSSLFDSVNLLIKRGELKGSAWKGRSTWEPILTSAFKSFYQSLEKVYLNLHDGVANPVRDLLKFHPSPLSLILKGCEFDHGLSQYAYTGGHQKAVELNVATEIELGLDSAARKEMAVGVVWLKQLDIGNSKCPLGFPNAVPLPDHAAFDI